MKLIFHLSYIILLTTMGCNKPKPNFKDKIKLTYVSGCQNGAIGVRFWNDSEYTVTKITFKIKGQIEGRSTIYALNDFAENDKILKQFEKDQGCWSITSENEPQESYKPFFELSKVEYLNGDVTEKSDIELE